MACPHAAGVAALILSKDSTLIPEEVRDILHVSADDIGEFGKDDYFGHGRVNAYKACTIGRVSIEITFPTDLSYIRNEGNIPVEIQGSAYIENENDFEKYQLFYAPEEDPGNLTPIIPPSYSTVRKGSLGTFDTTQCPDGGYFITLKVNTTYGKEVVRQIKVIIDNYNEPPVFINLKNAIAVINRPLEFKVEVYDPDDPTTPWGQLEYAADNLPTNATFDTNTQLFSWQPTESEKGNYEITFIAQDQDSEHPQKSNITIYTVYLKEIQITDDYDFERRPAIYKDKIVYDTTSDPWEEAWNHDIHMYDCAAKQEIPQEIPICTADGRQAYPVIYGDTIVWLDSRNGSDYATYYTPSPNYDIYMCNLTDTSKVTNITFDNTSQSRVSIYEDSIVWYDDNSGAENVYMYDIPSLTKIHTLPKPTSQYFPRIYNDRIVWHVREDDALVVYNVTTKERKTITTDSPFYDFDIFKNTVVWKDVVWGMYSAIRATIHVYDTFQDTEIQIDVAPEHVDGCESLDIYDDKIVWCDYQSRGSSHSEGVGSIYLYDLSKKAELMIRDVDDWAAADTYGYIDPAIWGNNIAFIRKYLHAGFPYGNDVFMIRLFFAPQISSITPTTAGPGLLITITGDDFGYEQYEDSNVVFANGVFATDIQSWSNTEITCRVPEGAVSGLVKVVTKGGESNGVEIKVVTYLEDGRYFEYMEYYPNGKIKVLELHAADADGTLLRVYIYHRDADGSNYSGKTMTYYKDDGEIEKIEKIAANGTRTYLKAIVEGGSYYVHEWQDDGRKIRRAFYDANDNPIWEDIYNYDTEGNYTGRSRAYTNGNVEEYAANGTRTYLKYILEDGRYYVHEWQDDGKKISRAFYDANTDPINDDPIWKDIYEYDAAGNRTRTRTYANGKINYYDAQNRCIKRVQPNGKYWLFTKYDGKKLITRERYLANAETPKWTDNFKYDDTTGEFTGIERVYANGRRRYYDAATKEWSCNRRKLTGE